MSDIRRRRLVSASVIRLFDKNMPRGASCAARSVSQSASETFAIDLCSNTEQIVSGKISRPLRRRGIGSKQRSLLARPSAPSDRSDFTSSARATAKQSFVLLGRTKERTMPFDSVTYPFDCKRLNLGALFSATVNPVFLQQRSISSETMKDVI